MNRRDAIAALVALPEVARISVTAVKATDVIVVESNRPVSSEAAARIKATLEQVWPGQKIVVLNESLKLKVVEGK